MHIPHFPSPRAPLFAWIVLLIAHSRAVKFAGGRVSDYPLYSRLSALILLFRFISDGRRQHR